MKKFILMVLILGTALSLVGCGKASSLSEDAPAQSVVYSSTDDEAYALQQVQTTLRNSATPTPSVGAYVIQNGEPIPTSVFFRGTLLTVQANTPPSGTPFPSTWYCVVYGGRQLWLTTLTRSQSGESRLAFKTVSAYSGQDESFDQIELLKKSGQTDQTQSEVVRTVLIHHGVFQTTVSESVYLRISILDRSATAIGRVSKEEHSTRVYAQGGDQFASSPSEITTFSAIHNFYYGANSFTATERSLSSEPVQIYSGQELNRVVGKKLQNTIQVYRNGQLVDLP